MALSQYPRDVLCLVKPEKNNLRRCFFEKIAAFVFLTFLLVSCVLCACDSREKEPFDEVYYQVSKTYIEFMETSMKDWPKAVNNFCNFGNEKDDDEITRVLSGDPVSSYEILRVEKLSNSLWVVETLTKTEVIPYGVYGVNYVGFLNGKWDIFLNLEETNTKSN